MSSTSRLVRLGDRPRASVRAPRRSRKTWPRAEPSALRRAEERFARRRATALRRGTRAPRPCACASHAHAVVRRVGLFDVDPVDRQALSAAPCSRCRSAAGRAMRSACSVPSNGCCRSLGHEAIEAAVGSVLGQVRDVRDRIDRRGFVAHAAVADDAARRLHALGVGRAQEHVAVARVVDGLFAAQPAPRAEGRPRSSSTCRRAPGSSARSRACFAIEHERASRRRCLPGRRPRAAAPGPGWYGLPAIGRPA